MVVRKRHNEYPEIAQSIPLAQEKEEGLKMILLRWLNNQVMRIINKVIANHVVSKTIKNSKIERISLFSKLRICYEKEKWLLRSRKM